MEADEGPHNSNGERVVSFNAVAEQITNIAGMKGALNGTPKTTAIKTDGEASPEPTAGDEPGRDGFDRALRAAGRVFRDSMLLGFGRDEVGMLEYFKANSKARKDFYAIMADYQSFEAVRLAERFRK